MKGNVGKLARKPPNVEAQDVIRRSMVLQKLIPGPPEGEERGRDLRISEAAGFLILSRYGKQEEYTQAKERSHNKAVNIEGDNSSVESQTHSTSHAVFNNVEKNRRYA